ncbi:MAG: hypothetical protein ABR508_01385 [Candidatus Baltobacteraceae bacterium]
MSADRYDGKTVLMTAGGSGLGRAMALAFGTLNFRSVYDRLANKI